MRCSRQVVKRGKTRAHWVDRVGEPPGLEQHRERVAPGVAAPVNSATNTGADADGGVPRDAAAGCHRDETIDDALRLTVTGMA